MEHSKDIIVIALIISINDEPSSLFGQSNSTVVPAAVFGHMTSRASLGSQKEIGVLIDCGLGPSLSSNSSTVTDLVEAGDAVDAVDDGVTEFLVFVVGDVGTVIVIDIRASPGVVSRSSTPSSSSSPKTSGNSGRDDVVEDVAGKR